MIKDDLGITEVENKQIDALSAGANPSDVANLTRQPVNQIPQQVPVEIVPDEYRSMYEPDLPAYDPKTASKRAITASLANNKDIDKDYVNIYSQLMSTGRSPTEYLIHNSIKDTERLTLKEQIKQMAREGNTEAVAASVSRFESDVEEKSDLGRVALKNASEGYRESSNTPQAEKHADIFAEELDANYFAKEKVNSIIDSFVADSSSNVGRYFAESFEAAVPLFQSVTLSAVGRDILGENYFVQHGNLFRDLAQKVRNLPADQQEAETLRIAEAIVRHSGFDVYSDKRTNDAVKVFALETFREFVNTPGGDIKIERYINNLFGVVDVVGVLPVGLGVKTAKKLLKVGKSSSSVASKANILRPTLDSANPNIDAAITAGAIQDPNLAKRFNTTQGEQASRVMPKTFLDDDTILDGAPASVIDKVNRANTAAMEASDFVENTFLYADPTFKKGAERIINAVSDSLNIAKPKTGAYSWIKEADSNRLTVRAIYGDETDAPLQFAKANEIKNNLEEHLKGNYEDYKVDIVGRDPITDTYGVDNNHATEWLVRVKVKDSLTPADSFVPGLYGAEEYTKPRSTVLGSGVKYLLNPRSYIQERLINAATWAHDQKFAKATEIKAVARDFFDLGWSGQRRVASLLEEGEVDEKVFSYSELKNRGYSDKEINGYLSVRLVNDTLYNIKNADERAKLVREGYEGLTITREGRENYSNAFKKVDEIPDGVTAIWDAENSVKIPLTPKTLEDLNKKGMVVGRLLSRIDEGNEIYHYAAVKVDDLHSLPQRVLAYRKGYNMRVNTDPYYIDSYGKRTVDGVRDPADRRLGTVHSARSYAEAQKTLAALEGTTKGVTHKIRIDRDINSRKTILENDIDLLSGDSTGYWYSRRGNRLTRKSDGSVSKVEDPVAALHRAISSVANAKTHGEMLESFEAAHRAKYDKVLGNNGAPLWQYDSQSGKYVFRKDLSKDVANSDVSTALLEYEYLEQLKYAPTEFDQRWYNFLEGMDAYFGDKLLSSKYVNSYWAQAFSAGSAKTIKALSSTTPGQFSRGLAFSLTIPLRPIRQFLLQSTTGFSLAGIDPGSTVRAFRDTNLMMLSLATWKNPKSWAATKKFAKAFGYAEDEWEDVFTSFRKSGKAYSIDSHVAIGEANYSWSRSLPETRLGRAAQITGNVLKFPVTAGKLIGFDSGELANQALTYLFSVNRWKKANPGKNWTKIEKAKQQIAVDARNYSVDMTKVDAFQYQKGAFASATQFMAINHKMLLKMLGQDELLKKDLAKYWLGIAAMYGTAAVGGQEFYDRWIKESGITNLDPTIDDLLQGGLMQAVFNRTGELLTGSGYGDVRLAASASLAPTSGVSFPLEMGKAIIEADRSFWDVLTGPSGNIASNIFNTASYVKDIWGFDNFSTPEKVMESFKVALEGFGGFSDLYKYNMMAAYHEKMGEYFVVDKTGRPMFEANSWGEIFLKSLTAMGTRGEQELWNKLLVDYKDVRSSGKKSQAKIDKDAEHLSKYLYQLYVTSENEEDFRKKSNAITYSLWNGPNSAYGHQVLKKAKSHFVRDPRYNQFVLDMISEKSRQIGDSHQDFERMRNGVLNSDILSDYQKQELKFFIDVTEDSAGINNEIFEEIMKQ